MRISALDGFRGPACGACRQPLGQDDSADLRTVLRSGADDAVLEQAVRDAIARKPKGHDFVIDRRRTAPSVARQMSLTDE